DDGIRDFHVTGVQTCALPISRPGENIGHIGATGPFGTYATQDGHIALAMMPCPRLGEILGVDWLAEFDTNEKMFAERDTIHRRLERKSDVGKQCTSRAWHQHK